jgi:hypothetical protein
LPRPAPEKVAAFVGDLHLHAEVEQLLADWGVHYSGKKEEKTLLDRDRDRDRDINPTFPSVTTGSGVSPPETQPGLQVVENPGPTEPGYTDGLVAFIQVLNEACGRRFDPAKQVKARGKDNPLAKYTQRRKEGWKHEEILAAARGAAVSPTHNGEKGQPYQDPITVLRSTVFATLVEYGKGERSPETALALPGRRPGPTRAEEIRARAATMRSQGVM